MAYSLYELTVPEAWLDYNQHMNAGYYNVVFDTALGAILDDVDLQGYMARTTGTFYSVETHIVYKRELKVGSPLRVESLIVGLDRKRLHIYSTIYHATAGFAAATGETMLLHYVQAVGNVLPMPDELFEPLAAIAQAQADLPRPVDVGRAIRPVH